MTNLSLVGFIIAFGFIGSAILWSCVKALQGGLPEFRLRLTSPASIIGSFFVCMFIGPYLVATTGLSHYVMGKLPLGLTTLAIGISILWSFCAGVIIVQLLVVSGVLVA